MKVVYLARRNPDIAFADWPGTWHSHADFASGIPALTASITDLLYCARPDETALSGEPWPEEASRAHDGVATLTREQGHPLDDEEIAAIWADERRVFDRQTTEFTFACTEHVVLDGSVGQAAVFRFLAARPNMDRQAFAERLLGAHADIAHDAAGAADHMTRYLLDRPVADPPADFPFFGIAESWFSDLGAAAASLMDPALAPVRADLAEFCDMERSVVMLTHVIRRGLDGSG